MQVSRKLARKIYLWSMDNQTNWTPGPDENKLRLTDKNLINE